MKTISRDELKAKMERGEAFFLVETLAESCYQHTHLPSAIHLSPIAAQWDAPTVLPDKRALVVLYCSDITCLASGDVAEKLQAMGYGDVRVYEGGKQDWMEAGLPVEGRSRMSAASKK